MSSKAEQWKRLQSLMRDPEWVHVVKVDGVTWITDRYVLVSPEAAQQDVTPEPGTWRLRPSGEPVAWEADKPVKPSAREVRQKIGQLAGLAWEPAEVTQWALADGPDHTWRLLVAGGEPVLMDDGVIRRWSAAFRGSFRTVVWHTARAGESSWARVARATLRVQRDYGPSAKRVPSEQVFGYLMGNRRQAEPLPPFPDDLAPPLPERAEGSTAGGEAAPPVAGPDRIEAARHLLETLAASLERSAAATRPSKKSEIEQGCADALREAIAELGAGREAA